MAEYLYRLETFAGEPSWEFTATHTSDAFAIAYAEQVARTSQAMRHAAIALLLFRTSDNQALLARFVIDKPVVRNTVG